MSDGLNLNFSKKANEYIAEGKKIISLGLGEPHFAAPIEIIESTIKAIRNGETKYCNPMGLIELRKLISQKLFEDNLIKTNYLDIAITHGAKQAILIALQALLKPNDEVINITPCFLSFVPLIRIAEPSAKIINVNLKKKDFSIDKNEIYEKISNKTKAILINFPHNPTGAILSEDDNKFFVDLLTKFPKCYLVSDELYESLIWKDFNQKSLGSFDEISKRVFTINGFSKSHGMTGWRIGYLSFPNKYRDKVSFLLKHSNMNVTTFVQKGACKAFESKLEHIKPFLLLVENNFKVLEDICELFNLKIIKPKAGFFVFINIKQFSRSSDEFCTLLLERCNIAFSPGIQFGDSWDDYVRVSLSVQENIFWEACQKFKQFLSTYLVK